MIPFYLLVKFLLKTRISLSMDIIGKDLMLH